MYCLLIACQPTPEKEFIVQKNQNSFLDKAASGDAGLPDALPDRYTAELKSKGGRLFVSADAAVVANNTMLPVVRIRPCGFDEEQVRRIGNVLFGDDAHYVKDDQERTRAYILRQAEELAADIEQWEQVYHKYDLVYYSKEEAQLGYEELLREASSAPETIPYAEPSYQELPMRGTQTSNSNTAIRIVAMPDVRTYSVLNVISMPEDGFVIMLYERDDMTPVDYIDCRDVIDETAVPSPEETRMLCDDALNRMGLEMFRYAGESTRLFKNGTVPARELLYTYTIDNAQMTFANRDTDDQEDYAAPWEQCYIRFRVDREGILSFEWKSPFEYVKTEVEAAAMLPFADITEIFENNVVIKRNQIDYNQIYPDLTETLHVAEVRLGLVSVREENAQTGLLVPAWDFLGYRSSDLNGRIRIFNTNEKESFLTINAVDGSIISRARGY